MGGGGGGLGNTSLADNFLVMTCYNWSCNLIGHKWNYPIMKNTEKVGK